MPQQISALQLYNLQHIISGDIPTTARRVADIADWTDHYRRMSMGTTSLDRNTLIKASDIAVQNWQKDYKSKIAADYMSRAKGYSSFRSESRDVSGGAGVIDELRQKKINKEACATEIFHRAMREGDWETAYYMIDANKDLMKLVPHVGNYGTKKALAQKLLADMGLKWLIDAIEAEGMSTLGVQCVAFIADVVNSYLGKNIVKKGYTGMGSEMLSKIVQAGNYDSSKLKDVTKDVGSDYNNLQFGDLIQLPGAHYGHVMMFIGYTKDKEPVFIEAVGELQDSSIDRWKGYSADMYKQFDDSIGLKPHIQIYESNYLGYNAGRTPSKILRMTDTNKLPKDTKEALQLLQLIVPSGNEQGGM